MCASLSDISGGTTLKLERAWMLKIESTTSMESSGSDGKEQQDDVA
jgi:hypothetical protein